MTQTERLDFLIQALLHEQPRFKDVIIPDSTLEKQALLRSLFNIRPALPIDGKFLAIQDEYLQEEIRNKGITNIDDLTPARSNLYLWQGDITTLQVDAIVNAANSQMLGCFAPCHGCIDNAIHTFAGIQLRLACSELMKGQTKPEATGTAKITEAFNLPSKYVLHTVGPIITGTLTKRDCALLASCYRSCLALAVQSNIESIAFCCISTGEFHFPNEKAADIALQTVNQFIAGRQSKIKVIFNVFKESDYEIYERLLRKNK